MRFQNTSLFLQASTLLVYSVTPCAMAADPVTSEQIAREWDAREKLVKSARLKWTIVETRAKETLLAVSGVTAQQE